MVATANTAHETATPRRPWAPNRADHLIFQWVKMEGHTQSWVASQLNIDQSTVSRVVQRYERWQAHAAEREGGRLDPAERLRAQRWLTFERNELLLTTALRIAGEMEGFTDVSKSTVRRPFNKPSQETEVRAEHAVIDRSGVAARFLRLAFRINMEQLKLAELDPPPPPSPLTPDELAEVDFQVTFDWQRQSGPADNTDNVEPEDRSVHERNEMHPDDSEHSDQSPTQYTELHEHDEISKDRSVHERSEMHHDKPEHRDQPPAQNAELHEPNEIHDLPDSASRPAFETRFDRSPAPPQPPTIAASLHNLHNDPASDLLLTANGPCHCASQPRAEKNPSTCITDLHPLLCPDEGPSRATRPGSRKPAPK